MYKSIHEAELSRQYNALGLDMGHRVRQDSYLETGTGKKITTRSKVKRFWYGGPISGLRDFLSRTEIGPRIMEFEGALRHAREQGWSEEAGLVLAGVASKDVTTNFSRSGRISAPMNEGLLFYNAAIQSVNKLLRSIGVLEPMPWQKSQTRKETFIKTAKRGSGLPMAAVLLWAINKDEEWWQELPDYEKWNYLHIPLFGECVARIPLPFEAGAIFASLPVAMLDGGESFSEAFVQAAKNASPINVDFEDSASFFHSAARNIAAIGPAVDVVANADWKGDPIISPTVQMHRGLPDQYTPYTTSFAKLLGETFPFHNKISPAQIDHLLNGYTGGLYRNVAAILSPKTWSRTWEGIREGEPSATILLGTLFKRPTTTRLLNDFYGDLKILPQRKGSGTATLEEIGRLSASQRLSRELKEDWEARRKLKSLKEQDAKFEEILAKIRKLNQRDDFSTVGAYSIVLSGTSDQASQTSIDNMRRLLAPMTRGKRRELLRKAWRANGWNSNSKRLSDRQKKLSRIFSEAQAVP